MVSDDAALSAALGAALAATGWPAVEVLAERRLADAARTVVRLGKLVLVADADGRLPDPRPALVGHARPQVVAVGTKSALPALADSVERLVAVAVLDAGQPFTELIGRLDHILRGVAVHVEPAPLLEALRLREQEARRFEHLTRREQEMLGALVLGHAAPEIARGWHVSVATVRTHIRAVLGKVGVRSQLAAVALAYRSCREPVVVEHLRQCHQF